MHLKWKIVFVIIWMFNTDYNYNINKLTTAPLQYLLIFVIIIYISLIKNDRPLYEAPCTSCKHVCGLTMAANHFCEYSRWYKASVSYQSVTDDWRDIFWNFRYWICGRSCQHFCKSKSLLWRSPYSLYPLYRALSYILG